MREATWPESQEDYKSCAIDQLNLLGKDIPHIWKAEIKAGEKTP